MSPGARGLEGSSRPQLDITLWPGPEELESVCLSGFLAGLTAGAFSARHCVVPVVMGRCCCWHFAMGRGRGGCAHLLPVVTGRFLFSQAPDLLLMMWKQGQLQPGRHRAGRPDSAQRGLNGPATPGPRLGGGWPELPPKHQAPIFLSPTASVKRKRRGRAVTQG